MPLALNLRHLRVPDGENASFCQRMRKPESAGRWLLTIVIEGRLRTTFGVAVLRAVRDARLRVRTIDNRTRIVSVGGSL